MPRSSRARRTVLALALFAATAASASPALADGSFFPSFSERLPGNAREISRSSSASRDTPVLEGAYGPASQSSVGLEFGTVRLHWEGISVRLGVHFLVALENHDKGVFAGMPFVASQLWRGLWGSSLAFTSRSLARQLFGPRGALEVTTLFGHETAHADADFRATHPGFGGASRRGDIRDGGQGNYFQHDLAVRLAPSASLDLVLRVQDRIYVTGLMRHAPGLDAALTWRMMPEIQPMIAIFAERLLVNPGENAAQNGGFARVMLGAVLPGKLGAVTPFLSLDGGNGKGYLVNQRELRGSFGLRYSPF
ncbi:MAG: hypothetical protein ABJE95_04280 [Byssovorax sp.]